MRKLFILLFISCAGYASACTNLIVGKNASADGSVFCSYSADSYGNYGYLRHYPGGTHAKGEVVKIYDYDTNVYHGEIPQAPVTYNVVGNINEYQVSIGETTFVGRLEMVDTTGIIDYGSLMYITLQRSKTAREAISVMTSLVEKYGYCSEGETFTICDPNEAWIMDMMGAPGSKPGVLWVAIRIPDDAICAHANQSRITTFNLKDKENVLYSKNVIKYARQKGWFSGKDSEFSFNAAYAAPDFSGRRICEARVWSFFNRFSNDMDRYLPYIEGKGEYTEAMPLWIIPNRKLTLQDVQESMRDHFEGTPFSMESDIGQGIWEMPYRPTPLFFEVDGKKYFNERPISTQQTGFTYVAQLRSFLPREVGGVLWFGNDDSNMIAYTPIYCCSTRIPECYNVPGADDVTFSDRSAFWVCNWVSNMVYPRYSMLFPSLREVRDSLERRYFNLQQAVERKAIRLLSERNDGSGVEHLTQYGIDKAQDMMECWRNLATYLIVKYNDMAVKPEKNHKFMRTPEGLGAHVTRPGYSKKVARELIKQTGDRYVVPEEK